MTTALQMTLSIAGASVQSDVIIGFCETPSATDACVSRISGKFFAHGRSGRRDADAPGLARVTYWPSPVSCVSDFRAWDFFGIWSLGFGASDHHMATQPMSPHCWEPR